MKPDLVTILLPSLNARQFLPERVDSLLAQTYTNWQAIILDSFSTDGTWEYFEGIAARDSRFTLYQIPKEGLYRALNRGIELADGEFLHIATCDDTMEPSFLQETVKSLQDTPAAGISATDVRFIDESGGDYIALHNGEGYVRSAQVGQRPNTINIRETPHDSYLHLSTHSVYFSLTQLLIRKSHLTPSDLFRTDVGSAADFGWLMNLTSHTSTVHIPSKSATWRIHGAQLSLTADPKRNQVIANFCFEFLKMTGMSAYKCFLFSLPAMKLQTYDGATERLPSGTYAKTGIFLIVALVTHPFSVAKSLRLAKFGTADLKTSWISFLMFLFGHANK